MRTPLRASLRRCLRDLSALILATVLALLLALLPAPAPSVAAPGLCVGPVCGDEITRSVRHPWQLRLRMADQRGHRERLLVDCRSGTLSPLAGPVDRGYAAAVARRACRLSTMMNSKPSAAVSSAAEATG